MKVSLCGPHSFDTSTLRPTDSDPLPLGEASGACVDRYWYLSHQVGLLGSRASAGKARASIAAAIRTVIWGLRGPYTYTGLPPSAKSPGPPLRRDPLTARR